MSDQRIENLAKILIQYSTAVKVGDKVIIRGFPLDPIATPLIAAVYREVLRAGGHPYTSVNLEGLSYIFMKEASDQQLLQPDPFAKLIAEEFDVDIRIGSDTNTRSLMGIDPRKWQLIGRAFAETNEIFSQRTGSGDMRWVVSRYPTNAYAQDANMSLTAFSDFFYSSTFADLDDPLSQWKIMHEKQEKLVNWLDGKKHVKITGKDIDLEMSIAGRTFISCHGQNNVPDGEIYTGPVENSVNGWVRYSFPCIWSGNQVDGVELVFENGKVVKASAEKNEQFLQAILNTDAGARVLGEFGIGTNKQINRFTGNMLFDEKIGGTIHLAIGNGYPASGSLNKSAIHWDMLCDMRDGGQIFVDQQLFYDSGDFKI